MKYCLPQADLEARGPGRVPGEGAGVPVRGGALFPPPAVRHRAVGRRLGAGVAADVQRQAAAVAAPGIPGRMAIQ